MKRWQLTQRLVLPDWAAVLLGGEQVKMLVVTRSTCSTLPSDRRLLPPLGDGCPSTLWESGLTKRVGGGSRRKGAPPKGLDTRAQAQGPPNLDSEARVALQQEVTECGPGAANGTETHLRPGG